MKKLTLLMLSAVFVLFLSAKDVTRTQALEIARSFLQKPGGPKMAPSMSGLQLRLAYTGGAPDGKSCFYAFNMGTDGGFVIVSADDRANAILGYSDTGSFDYARLSPEMKNWLAGYADEITYIRNSRMPEREAGAVTLDKEVRPLLGDIQWNQDSPYNDLCPSYSIGTRCATGCVATAMAQVMYYHRWPETGTGQHTYNPSILGGTSLTADFGSTRYAWDDMLPRYDGSSSGVSREAVALLMLHCGIAVDMDYSTSSGATSESVPQALTSYFNYDKGIAYRTRGNYGSAEWEDIIISELDNGRPMVALGRSSTGGHCFVFDGYDRNGLIHVNWGWGGMSNGYFRTSALTPAVQGVGGSDGGYNYDQYIVTGIQPPQSGTEEDVELVSTEGLVPAEMKIANGGATGFRLCGMLINAGYKDSEFDYGLMLTGADGSRVKVIETGTGDVLYVGYQMPGPEFKDISLGTLDDGAYTLLPVCRVKGGKGSWHRIRSEYVGYPNYIYVKAEGNEITFSYPDYFDLSVADMQLPREVYSGLPVEIKATIANNGDVDYLGEVRLSVVDRQTKRSVLSGTPNKIDLAPGRDVTVVFSDVCALEPGDYSVTMVDDDNRRIAPYTDIMVNAAPAEAAVLEPAVQLSFADNERVDRMSMDITAEVTCRQGVFGGWLYIYLFNESGTQQLGCLEPEYLFIKEGETANVTFGGVFENGVPGTRYTACLMTYDGTSLTFLEPMEMAVCQFRLDGTSSVGGVETGAEEPVEVYDISGKRLPCTDTGSLPEGIYIIRQGNKTFKLAK